MTTFILTVLSHTPVWVWALLAGLVALGLNQSRDHVLSRGRVLLQPIALSMLSIFSATSAFGLHAHVQPLWLAGMALGFALNRPLMLPRQVQALPDGRFAIGGSWAPLLLILAIFVLRYVGSASLAVVPELAQVPAFAAIASLLYGLPSGLLAARAQRCLAQAQALPRLATA